MTDDPTTDADTPNAPTTLHADNGSQLSTDPSGGTYSNANDGTTTTWSNSEGTPTATEYPGGTYTYQEGNDVSAGSSSDSDYADPPTQSYTENPTAHANDPDATVTYNDEDGNQVTADSHGGSSLNTDGSTTGWDNTDGHLSSYTERTDGTYTIQDGDDISTGTTNDTDSGYADPRTQTYTENPTDARNDDDYSPTPTQSYTENPTAHANDPDATVTYNDEDGNQVTSGPEDGSSLNADGSTTTWANTDGLPTYTERGDGTYTYQIGDETSTGTADGVASGYADPPTQTYTENSTIGGDVVGTRSTDPSLADEPTASITHDPTIGQDPHALTPVQDTFDHTTDPGYEYPGAASITGAAPGDPSTPRITVNENGPVIMHTRTGGVVITPQGTVAIHTDGAPDGNTGAPITATQPDGSFTTTTGDGPDAITTAGTTINPAIGRGGDTGVIGSHPIEVGTESGDDGGTGAAKAPRTDA